MEKGDERPQQAIDDLLDELLRDPADNAVARGQANGTEDVLGEINQEMQHHP